MERILNFEKMLRIMFVILFLLFAILQWNDPDAVLWIVNYCMAAVISIGAISNLKYSNWIFRIALTIIGSQAIFLALKVFGKDHLWYAEAGREFLGLLIVFFWIFWIELKSMNDSKQL